MKSYRVKSDLFIEEVLYELKILNLQVTDKKDKVVDDEIIYRLIENGEIVPTKTDVKAINDVIEIENNRR